MGKGDKPTAGFPRRVKYDDADGVQFKLSCLQRVFAKRAEVANSTTKEQIMAINW